MAMTKTSKLTSVEIFFRDNADAVMWVRKHTTWDDPDDDDAPVTKTSNVELHKVTLNVTENEDGTQTTEEVVTDISGEDQLVQDIAAVVWA